MCLNTLFCLNKQHSSEPLMCLSMLRYVFEYVVFCLNKQHSFEPFICLDFRNAEKNPWVQPMLVSNLVFYAQSTITVMSGRASNAGQGQHASSQIM